MGGRQWAMGMVGMDAEQRKAISLPSCQAGESHLLRTFKSLRRDMWKPAGILYVENVEENYFARLNSLLRGND